MKERVTCFRKISDIDLDHIRLIIGDLQVVASADQYYTVFTSILNDIVVSFKRSSPWYTSELRQIKAKGRQLEQKYKKSALNVHRSIFDQHQIEYHNALKAANMAYYSLIISIDISNPRVLFRTVNNLIKPPSNINCSTTEQCNEFLNSFSSKLRISITLLPVIMLLNLLSCILPISLIMLSQVSMLLILICL